MMQKQTGWVLVVRKLFNTAVNDVDTKKSVRYSRVLVVTELVVRGYFPNISACPSRQDLKNNFLDSKIHSSGMSIKTVTVTTCLHVIGHLHCRRRTRLRTQTGIPVLYRNRE